MTTWVCLDCEVGWETWRPDAVCWCCGRPGETSGMFVLYRLCRTSKGLPIAGTRRPA